jgi:hypothetical protein
MLRLSSVLLTMRQLPDSGYDSSGSCLKVVIQTDDQKQRTQNLIMLLSIGLEGP